MKRLAIAASVVFALAMFSGVDVARADTSGVEVTSIAWTCAPNPLSCTGANSRATVTAQVTFKLQGSLMDPTVSVTAELWDWDTITKFWWWPDDYLGQANQTITLQNPGGGRSVSVTKKFAFDVHCDEDCYVAGIAGTSGEESAECYVVVLDADTEEYIGDPSVDATISCVSF